MAARTPLELVGLPSLMQRTAGWPEVIVDLIDGPVAMDHPDFARESIREVPGRWGMCARGSSAACTHGTFGAPGEAVRSLTPRRTVASRSGTSLAAPFVTGTPGAAALRFPIAAAGEVRFAATHGQPFRRRAVVPPLLDARAHIPGSGSGAPEEMKQAKDNPEGGELRLAISSDQDSHCN
jgi:hypothetical protein